MGLTEIADAIKSASENEACALRHVIDGTGKCPDIACRTCVVETKDWANGFAKLVGDAREKALWVDGKGGIEAIEARMMPEGMSWPRFEDGSPVLFGGRAACGTAELDDPIDGIAFYANGTFELFADMNTISVDGGERVKRPPVLAADGEPLEVGQTVWVLDDGREWTVSEIINGTVSLSNEDGIFHEYSAAWVPSEQLTHHRPVLDADGVPIKVGDTVYVAPFDDPLTVRGFAADGRVLMDYHSDDSFGYSPENLTHTKPEQPDSRRAIVNEIGDEMAARIDLLVSSGRWSHERADR